MEIRVIFMNNMKVSVMLYYIREKKCVMLSFKVDYLVIFNIKNLVLKNSPKHYY